MEINLEVDEQEAQAFEPEGRIGDVIDPHFSDWKITPTF